MIEIANEEGARIIPYQTSTGGRIVILMTIYYSTNVRWTWRDRWLYNNYPISNKRGRKNCLINVATSCWFYFCWYPTSAKPFKTLHLYYPKIQISILINALLFASLRDAHITLDLFVKDAFHWRKSSQRLVTRSMHFLNTECKKRHDRGSLFVGNESVWAGIDVMGSKALRCNGI